MQEITVLREKAGLTRKELAHISGFDQRTVYRWENGEAEPRPAILEILRSRIENRNREVPEGRFKFIDLFAGIGGIRKGFDSIGGKCVFTSEWDSNCQHTYRANFPKDNHEIAGDIRNVDTKDIPEHDVLLAGFPCQPFSIAGVSKKNSLQRAHGFADLTQGTLFFDVARIIADCKPKVFLLENVKNLKSHDKGNTFKIIKKVLEEDLGYHVTTRIIDAKSFAPQHRERIFIVGFRKDVGFDIGKMPIPDPQKGPKLGSILHSENTSEVVEPRFIDDAGNILEKYTLTPKLWQYLQDYSAKHKAKGNGFGFGLVGPENVTRTLSARYYKDGSEILVKQGKDERPRRLTPRECARLMGFDKPNESKFLIPVSDTQAYKQFGNAVVVPVIEAIAKYMEPWLMQVVNDEPSQFRLPMSELAVVNG